MNSPSEPLAGYTLTGNGEILEKLRILERQRTLLVASLDETTDGYITTIVTLIPDKGLLALDISADEDLNERMQSAAHIVVTATVDGIQMRFKTGKATLAVLNGNRVLAVAIPTALFWLQRRLVYRVPIPYSMDLRCRIPLAGGKLGEFQVLNLSLKGLAILDKGGEFDPAADLRRIYIGCRLGLPVLATDVIDLEMRYRADISDGPGRRPLHRVGFRIVNASRGFEVQLQKQLYELEILNKQANDRIRRGA